MKAIAILSICLMLTWFVLSLLQPENGSVYLDENTSMAMKFEANAQKILFLFSIVIESLLCYKLYKLATTLVGFNKQLAIFLSIIILIVTVVSLVIFYVGLTAYWL